MAASPRVNFRLPQEQLNSIDYLVKYNFFDDRSAFFREATEKLLEKCKLEGML